MKIKTIFSALLLLTLLSSCASLRPRNEQITLQAAVDQTICVLNKAYQKTQDLGGTWGLKPSEVTIVYNISDEKGAGETLKLGAGYASATIGGELGFTQKAITGNTVTLKFTQDGK